MKLYNPTLDTIFAKYAGIPYFVLPMQTISVSEETGRILFQRFEKFGLVDLTIGADDIDDVKNLVPRRILGGMYKYLEHLNENLENWVKLDSEYKNQNIFQTVLKNKFVVDLEAKRERIIKTIEKNEKEYGIKIRTEDIDQKTLELSDEIARIMLEYEEDAEKYKKGIELQAEADRILESLARDVSAD